MKHSWQKICSYVWPFAHTSNHMTREPPSQADRRYRVSKQARVRHPASVLDHVHTSTFKNTFFSIRFGLSVHTETAFFSQRERKSFWKRSLKWIHLENAISCGMFLVTWPILEHIAVTFQRGCRKSGWCRWKRFTFYSRTVQGRRRF